MRNFKLTVCALALGMASSSFVNAAVGQGTVEFNGELTANTCTIDADSQNIVVTLPTLSTKTLAKAGDTGGSKLFDINVSECDAAVTKVTAHFEAIGGSGSDATTGNLTNDADAATAAKEVQIRLYDADESQLALGDTGKVPAAVDANTHKASMRYYGGYYATGQTTAGKVHAKAQYTLAYP